MEIESDFYLKSYHKNTTKNSNICCSASVRDENTKNKTRENDA